MSLSAFVRRATEAGQLLEEITKLGQVGQGKSLVGLHQPGGEAVVAQQTGDLQGLVVGASQNGCRT
ncbi:MAG: hypothetical protein BWY72_00868 [Bacteroidetes bacterium ADurb.Bin416]|nr:MAG: hypothetical protein BWY72_00868 [Bacteroidetes bacterium ADurb.Bin416]